MSLKADQGQENRRKKAPSVLGHSIRTHFSPLNITIRIQMALVCVDEDADGHGQII